MNPSNIDDLEMPLNLLGAIDKLMSKLPQHDNTDIPLYPVYLPKLHKNFLKYYRLNLFKEFGIGFNHCLQMTLECPVSFTDILLV